MPVLIGELEKITGSPSSVTQVMVRAHTTRITGAALTTDELVPIPVDRQGRFEVPLRPGKAVLVLVHGGRVGEGERFPMLVEEGLGTIVSAIKLASDRFDDYELDELERAAADMLASLDKGLVAARRAEVAQEGAEKAQKASEDARDKSREHRDAARTAAGTAAEEAATDAVQRADEKLTGYISTAQGHVITAKGHAGDSAGSATAAGKEADRAETARQGAETIEKNLPTKVGEEVTTQLPGRLDAQLPGKLAAQLPSELDERVPPKVAAAIADDRAVADAAAAAIEDAAEGVDLMPRATAENLIDQAKWYRGEIPEDRLIDEMMSSADNGIWTLSSGRAEEMGMPRVVAYHVEVVATGNIVTQEATAHLSPPVIYMRRGRLGEWSMEWEQRPRPEQLDSIDRRITDLEESGPGGVAREEDAWAMERRVREMDMRNRVGQVTVGQRGVVALVFDHGTKNFRDIVFPALQERGLPATLALSPEAHLDPRPTTGWETATNAEIQQWSAAGIEIANHSGDHKGASGYDDMYRNIITSANTLEAELGTPVDSWVQPGYPTDDPDYDGFGRGYNPEVFYETTAGRMILRRHPMITGMDPDSDGDNVYPVTGHPPLAIRRTSFDQKTDRARTDIQTAIDEGGRTVVFCHPYAIYDDTHTGGFTTRSEFLSFLDWIVQERDAGRLEVLTLREWAVAERQVDTAHLDAADQALGKRITDEKWERPQVSNIDANTFDTPGLYPLNLTSGATNLPVNAPGVLEVMGISTQLIQRFTRRSPHQIFVRNRTVDGTAWSEWSPIHWVVNGIGTNHNADSISLSGMYPVTQAGVPNLPESAIGTLEVVTFSGVVFQTFTSVRLNVWRRRKVSGGAWLAWAKTPNEGDIQQAIQDAQQGGVSPADSYVREGAGMHGAGLYLREIVETDISGKKYPTVSTDDGTKMWNGNSVAIEETTDGVTWTKVHSLDGGTFTFLRPLPDGEVLICFVPFDGSPRQIKKSVGYGTEGMTFKTVINPTSPTVRYSSGWSYFQEGDRVLVAEYGSKYPSVGEGEWPRYVYYSNDCGDTFRPIFNLWDFLASHGVEQQNELHLHGVAYDKYWDRIWVTWGDNTNGIAYSDDEGETWHVGNLYLNANDPWQGVGIYPMPECILVGSDLTPNGVWRIDRKQGKTPDGQYEFEAAYKINDSVPRTHLCQNITRIPGMDGRPDLVLFGFGAESNPGESIVVGTWDGWGFNVMYRHGELHAAGQGLRGVVPVSDGTVHINMQFGSQRLLVSGKSWSVARQLAG